MPDPIADIVGDAQSPVELDRGRAIDGFHRGDDRVPQRLVTATGPDPLVR